MVVYRENIFIMNQLKLKCMWKHPHEVLILVCLNHDPQGQDWATTRDQNFTYLYQVSDVYPELLFRDLLKLKIC